MPKIRKIFIPAFVLLILILPVFSFAQVDDNKPDPGFSDGKTLVPCGHADETTGVINNPCSFGDALTMINGIIKFIFIKLVVPIAAIMFAYAGFKLVTSGGNAEARGTAKKIFTNAVIGLVLAAGAWLIIRTLLSILGFDGDWIGLK